MRASPQLKADVVILLTTALWGVTFVMVKDSLGQADPFTFLVLRFGLAALAAAVWAGRDLLHGPSLRAGAFLGLFLFAGYALQTTGLDLTTPSRSAFITGMTVVFVLIQAAWLMRRNQTASEPDPGD